MKGLESMDLRAAAENCEKKANTTASSSSRIKLFKRPFRRYLPDKDRHGEGIDPQLKALLFALCQGQAKWPLFLHGDAGRGKTCAGLWLADYALGLYFAAADLGEAVRKEMVSPSGSVREFWKHLAAANLVVIDEIGVAPKVSDHHQSCLKTLLDFRENKPLLALSNVGLNAVAEIYGDPVSSRLAAGTDFKLKGPDRRLL